MYDNLNKTYYINMKNILASNHQLILTGAPGTGKTYAAKKIISKLMFDNECNNEIQIKLVQFHPSFDYTDFIEGIRPTLSSSNIGYELKNGIFKEFCRNAGVIERILASNKSINNSTIERFAKTRLKNKKVIDFWENWWDNTNSELKNNKKLLISELPRFIFIIDEINRAEISKVIGEVMFSIDSEYRGIEGVVETQYASLADENTFFINIGDDKFFIPSNVYIIGTMNDIDRSVEVFDYALRRRFAWIEIVANEVMEDVLINMLYDTAFKDNIHDLSKRAIELNNSITNKLKLSKNYHLGPAYFSKISLYYNADNMNYNIALEQLWSNHLLQILNEYTKNKLSNDTIKEIGDKFTIV